MKKFWQIDGKKLDIVLPLLLALFSLAGINQGADLTDTTYSLGNYLFFNELGGEWIYATFLANAAGHLLMFLTGGKMIWMNAAGRGSILLTALIVYYAMKDRIPRGILFAGEVLAIGLCWCPGVIFYNYLTYLLLTAAAVVLYKAVLTKKSGLFLAAGLLLGVNVFVRISNLTEMALILVVWYGLMLSGKSQGKGIFWKQTGLCIAGYLSGILTGVLLMFATIGIQGYTRMIDWLFSLFTSGEDAGGYSMTGMLGTILDNYLGNLRWLFFVLLGIFMGIVMFCIKKGCLEKWKKFFYMAGIVLLGIYFYRNGIYDFKYYNVGSIFHLSVVAFLVEYILCLVLMFHKKAEKEDKLLAAMAVIILLITPLGSNNHLYTCINNMFLTAPFGIYAGYRLWEFYRDRVWIFPCSSMGIAFVMLLLVQSVMFHQYFVFRDGIGGEKRDTVIATEDRYGYLNGMKTNREHAEAIEGLTEYAAEALLEHGYLLTYGNLPGTNYLLHKLPALTTIWPDLESYDKEQFQEELEALSIRCMAGSEKWPVLILSPQVAAYVTEDAEGMEYLGVDPETYREDEKVNALSGFMMQNGYGETYSNAEFVVFMIP
ncbi:MAG: hypothetical protein ACI4DW_00910 [Lachnospiraceae bacterium]